MVAHACALGVPYYVPAFVWAARFGGDDTALVVTTLDGLGYVVALCWSKAAASLAESSGWGVVFAMLTFIALFTVLLWHLFFDAAHDIMCEKRDEAGFHELERGEDAEDG